MTLTRGNQNPKHLADVICTCRLSRPSSKKTAHPRSWWRGLNLNRIAGARVGLGWGGSRRWACDEDVPCVLRILPPLRPRWRRNGRWLAVQRSTAQPAITPFDRPRPSEALLTRALGDSGLPQFFLRCAADSSFPVLPPLCPLPRSR